MNDFEEELPREYEDFIRLFNAGEFYDAHEVLEDLWAVEVAPLRDYYKGLIQAAGSMVLYQKGNRPAALRLWTSGRGYLAPYAPYYERIALDRLMLLLDSIHATQASLEALPKIEFLDERTERTA